MRESARSRFGHASPDAVLFCEPSAEAKRLLRVLPSLTTPVDGRGALPWRLLRTCLVAPFTQLTFVSFDLQMFLFDVFHTSVAARLGHFVGMTGVNLFVMALAAHGAGPLGVGLVAAVLLAWWGAVAWSTRLALWWLVMVPVTAALAVAATFLATASASWLLLGLALSGAVVSFSHAFEPLFPPRAGDPLRWMTISEFVSGGPMVPRVLQVASFVFLGWLDELWASPRLLPYNVLRLMLSAGYAPELRRELDARAAEALASGNPALDYVGIGGGSFLAPE